MDIFEKFFHFGNLYSPMHLHINVCCLELTLKKLWILILPIIDFVYCMFQPSNRLDFTMEEKNKATFRTLESNKFIYSGPDITVLDTSKETLLEISLRSPLPWSSKKFRNIKMGLKTLLIWKWPFEPWSNYRRLVRFF